VSVLREVFSRIIELGQVTLAAIVREFTATLRRKEESRIYHWVHTAKKYPPSRSGGRDQAGEAIARSEEEAANVAPRPPPWGANKNKPVQR
jgi:hypothetical protein